MSDIEREEFEQAVTDRWSNSYSFTRFGDEDYYDEVLEGMWWAWQASREALEGEPIGYVVPRMLEAMQAGKYCGISISDEQKAGDIAVYTHPVSADEWIKCSERLPSETDHYLVALSDPEDVGWVTDKAWTAFYNKCGEWDCCEAVEDGQPVTHWMPLPAPPQEQGQ